MTIESGSPSCWVIAPRSSYKTQCWDDDALVYVRQTGDTHLLTAFSFAILNIISESNGVDSTFISQRLDAEHFISLGVEEVLHNLHGLNQFELIIEVSA